jgi:MoxR-like ATPase
MTTNLTFDTGFYNSKDIQTIKNLNIQMDTLCSYFKERDRVVEGMFISLLSRNHCVMIGPPGTGKSYLIESFVKGFDNMNLFTWQLNKFSQMEELFGPYSLLALKEGRYERVSDHKLQNAEIAYLDEIYNGNSSILNAMNSLMNERIFERIHTPLHSIFSGTNFIPEDNVLLAFHDRFLYRFIIDEIQNQSNFEAMLASGGYGLSAKNIICKIDLMSLQDLVKTINYDKIIPLLTKLREALLGEKIYPSSRRFRWAIQALQAKALLEGRSHVDDEDLFILKDILWVDKKDIPIVELIVGKVVCPAIKEIQDLVNQARDIQKKTREKDPDKGEDLQTILMNLRQLKNISGEIKNIMRTRVLTPRIMEIATQFVNDVDRMRKELRTAKMPDDD